MLKVKHSNTKLNNMLEVIILSLLVGYILGIVVGHKKSFWYE